MEQNKIKSISQNYELKSNTSDSELLIKFVHDNETLTRDDRQYQ